MQHKHLCPSQAMQPCWLCAHCRACPLLLVATYFVGSAAGIRIAALEWVVWPIGLKLIWRQVQPKSWRRKNGFTSENSQNNFQNSCLFFVYKTVFTDFH